MKETLYKKVGRKYVPFAMEYDRDVLRVGQFRLHYCYANGAGMYAYDVTPDTAGFVAAAMIAQKAMEEKMAEAAKMTPNKGSRPYTKTELATIDEFRERMGGMFPTWWTQTSAWDIAKTGIDTVRNYKP